MKKGRVITFEGLDGAGKTTQGKLLYDYLSKEGIETSIHSLYKNDLVERMLMRHDQQGYTVEIGARYAVVSKVLSRYEWLVYPRIDQGRHFIFDKYIYTFMATEIVRGAELNELQQMFLDLPRPDISFVFMIDPSELLTRKKKFGRIGYRESGMDLVSYQGEPVDFNRFQEGGYPTEWIEEQFLLFQHKLIEAFEAVIEGEKKHLLDTPDLRSSLCRIDATRSVDKIRQQIQLTITQSQRG